MNSDRNASKNPGVIDPWCPQRQSRGLFTYVFYAMAVPGDGERLEYKFLTNSDGEHVAKTSMGMFEDLLIDNDMAEIIKVIDAYNEGE